MGQAGTPRRSSSWMYAGAMPPAKPRFFRTQDDFRGWLDRNQAKRTELIVGYWKVDSGKPSMTWSESVDQALCYGWIDGIRRRIDDESYCIRFTPRKPGSRWSDVNLKKVTKLKRAGLMEPEGLAAWKRRVVGRKAGYAYEEETRQLSPPMEREFRANRKAWSFFRELPPSYKQKIVHWLTSAKQASTRERRLRRAIASCEAGERP